MARSGIIKSSNESAPLSPSFQQNQRYIGYAKIALAVVLLVLVLAGLQLLLMNPARIEAFLSAAKAHPGTTLPLFMLGNLFAPIFLLPSGPFQVED